jgi:hypothetical protein
VGGSTKDIGKTSLVCGVISALRDLGWTAVKITGHDYGPKLSASSANEELADTIVWEEMNAGQATDTARYLAAGALRALLVTRHGPEVPIEEIRAAIGKDRNVIFESNRIIGVMQADLCLALVGGAQERKPSFVRLSQKADALVSVDGFPVNSADLRGNVPCFRLQSLDQLSAEMVTWMRSRLNLAFRPDS